MPLLLNYLIMVLYCKKAFHQFKKGQKLPTLNPRIALDLVNKGWATLEKPKPKTKAKTKK